LDICSGPRNLTRSAYNSLILWSCCDSRAPVHYACRQERRRCRRRLLCPVQLLIMWHQRALSLMKEPHSLDLSSRLPNTRRSGCRCWCHFGEVEATGTRGRRPMPFWRWLCPPVLKKLGRITSVVRRCHLQKLTNNSRYNDKKVWDHHLKFCNKL